MDKFDLSKKMKTNEPVVKNEFIVNQCIGKKVLDLGCVRHSAEYALHDPNWLHKQIKSVASEILGVDYLKDDVEILQKHGYRIICDDVTEQLHITDKFDIIVAGDLIEHLSNFNGFFANCERLLKDNGCLIITTGNPFYIDQFFYVAMKRQFLVNPEHTCWIDPLSLIQLASRFGYVIEDVRYLKGNWFFKYLAAESKNHSYDILYDRWKNDNLYFKIWRRLLAIIVSCIYFPVRCLLSGWSPLIARSDYIMTLVNKR